MPHPLDAVAIAAFVANLVGAFLALAALVGLRRVFPRAHMVAWTWAWLAAVVRQLGSLLLALNPVGGGPLGIALRSTLLLLGYLQAGWLLVGAYEFLRSTGPPARLRRVAVIAPVLIALGTYVVLVSGLPPRSSAVVRLVIPLLVLGAASLGAAWLVSRRRPEAPAVGDRVVTGALSAYGALRLYESAVYVVWLGTGRMPAHVTYVGFVDFLILGLLGLGTVVCLLEDEHRVALRAVRERTQSEHALQEERDRLRLSEEKFAKAFRSSPDAVTIARLKDGRYLDVGGGFERIFGYAPSEAIGRTSVEMGLWVDPADRDRLLRALEESEGGRISDCEVGYRTRSGEARFCSLSAEKIQIEGEACLIAITRDITERKKGERALAQSQERFAKIFRSSPDPISISTLEEGRYLDVNEAYERVFGYARGEVLGRSALDIGIWANPEQRTLWVNLLKGRGGVRDLPVELLTRSGARRLCSLSAEVIRLGEEEYIVTVARDMTDRLAAEARLRDSEERLRLALDAARMGTWEWNAVSGAAAWSPQVDAILGLPPGTVGGTRTYLDLVHPEDRQSVQESIGEILRGRDGEFLVEYRIVNPAGTARWLEGRGRIDRDEAGRPLRLRGTVVDITARKQGEQALRDSEERLRRISEASFEGIGFSENGLVVDANSQLAAMLGYEPSELVGRPVTALVAPVDREKVEGTLTRGGATAYEHLAIRKDGSTLLVEVRGRPLEQAGRALRVTAVRDVSERVRLETELQRSQTLSAVGELVTGVAHEVRTPLFSISATLDAYEGQLSDAKERDEFMALLRSQVRRLTNLMTDLLDYGKPPALRLVRGDVTPVLRRALRSCASAAAEAGVELAEDIVPALPAVERDEGRLEQVFQNLLANAVQLSPRGSTVRVRARDARGGVACTIEDQGPGLPAGDLERVFEPFFTRRKGGTGLGLSIVRRIVEEHGGRVTAANHSQGGAVFTVWLPAASGGTR